MNKKHIAVFQFLNSCSAWIFGWYIWPASLGYNTSRRNISQRTWLYWNI